MLQGYIPGKAIRREANQNEEGKNPRTEVVKKVLTYVLDWQSFGTPNGTQTHNPSGTPTSPSGGGNNNDPMDSDT
jgi:hypothetical protein